MQFIRAIAMIVAVLVIYIVMLVCLTGGTCAFSLADTNWDTITTVNKFTYIVGGTSSYIIAATLFVGLLLLPSYLKYRGL